MTDIKHFMVRVLRSDGEEADVVVKAESKGMAEKIALDVVNATPDAYFAPPDPPHHYVDSNWHETEEVDPSEYAAANE